MIAKTNDIITYLLKEDKEKKFELKEYKEKRSLNANAYAWKLIGEIAKVIKSSNDEVYETMLQRYGTNLLDTEDNIVIISSTSELKSASGLHIDFIGTGEVKDKTFRHYRVIKGSSEYNSKEMSDFIEGIVSEAKELSIETLDDLKINKMIESWK